MCGIEQVVDGGQLPQSVQSVPAAQTAVPSVGSVLESDKDGGSSHSPSPWKRHESSGVGQLLCPPLCLPTQLSDTQFDGSPHHCPLQLLPKAPEHSPDESQYSQGSPVQSNCSTQLAQSLLAAHCARVRPAPHTTTRHAMSKRDVLNFGIML